MPTERLVNKVLQGAASNVLRLLFTFLFGVVLPRVLVGELSRDEYSAWVLILQLSSYVGLLDIGLQTVVAKFVAEHHSTGDRDSNHRIVSTAFTLLACTAAVGGIAALVLAWQVPHLFGDMPPALYPQMQVGLLAVGLSSAFSLPFGVFLSVFTGLQSYLFPTVIGLGSRALSAGVLIALTLMGGGLAELAVVLAVLNVLTAAAQYLGWRRFARAQVDFTFFFMTAAAATRLLKSGSVIAVWSIGALLVSGLDTVIVGHFDYRNTGYYALAASGANFMLLVVNSVFSPLMPAVSAAQATRTPSEIGSLMIRASRYYTLVLCAVGLPLLVLSLPLLTIWVGSGYAGQTDVFLRLLVIGTCVRLINYPYSLVVIATGRQALATAASVAEAIVNLGVSLWLVLSIGAVGVAIGTIVGAALGALVHFAVSMRLTQPEIRFRVIGYLRTALLRPAISIVPLLLLIPFWRPDNFLPAPIPILALWVLATALVMIYIGLTRDDRSLVRQFWYGSRERAGRMLAGAQLRRREGR